MDDDIDATPITLSQPSDQSDRPNGSVMLPMGWSSIALGAICVLIAQGNEPTDYMGRIDPDKVANAALLMGGGEAFLQLGVLMLLAGYIVRAISFLPGKDAND